MGRSPIGAGRAGHFARQRKRNQIPRMLSFIVPAYNEELELPATIASIRTAAEKIDNGHEIVVVDDASTDATAQIAHDAGAQVVSINRRQIAAARNAGVHAARGTVFIFVDADTRINSVHVTGALAALNAGYAGGSARVIVDGAVPLWGRVFLKIFCTLYFANNLGAGAFLFTTREKFEKIGGFNEELFVGEEVYLSLALRKLGRFKVLREPIVTSGRKLRMYPARQIFGNMFAVIFGGMRVVTRRDKLDIWYDGKRESRVREPVAPRL
jgi:glycosyltransferase involved in cell wall biosynthesis